jgi:uncharacterized protein YbjT (DUF2867 family)
MILVTGATGTSGSEIVKALQNKAQRIRVLARNPEKAAALGEDIDIARGDLTDPASLDAAMEGVEKALLLTPSNPRLPEMESNFIDAAKRANVRHLVKFSVYLADPQSPMRFMRQHAEIESKLKASGIAWTMLRPTFFMQNLLDLAGMIKSGAIYMPTGNGRASYVDVRDIAAVAATALSESGHEGQTYPITGPQSVSYADIAAIFSRVLGREIKHVDVPPEAAKQALMQAGIPEWSADGINELNAGVKAGQFDHVFDTVTKVARKEPINLEQFIAEHRSTFQ